MSLTPPIKPRMSEINWQALKDATKGDPEEEVMRSLLETAEHQVNRRDPILLPWDTCEGLEEMIGDRRIIETMKVYGEPDPLHHIVQMETGAAVGTANGAIMVPVSKHTVVLIPLGMTGCTFYNYAKHTHKTPAPFINESRSSEMGEYCRLLWGLCIAGMAMLRVPEERETVMVSRKPKRRGVRKGKIVNVPAYTLVHLHPGQTREVRSTGESNTGHRGGYKMPYSEVDGFWTHRNCKEDCDHAWQDITTPEVLSREQCSKCSGKRTYVRGFSRGDPTVKRKTKAKVLHI